MRPSPFDPLSRPAQEPSYQGGEEGRNASNRERVLHHALMEHVGPALDRALVADTFACRESKGTLAAVGRVEAFLAERLHLTMKPSWQVQRSDRGLTFCGFRIFPGRLRLSARRQRRYARGRRRWETAYALGLIDDLALQAGATAALAITAHADAAGWRRRELARRPPPEV